ncbi:MAG: hypothetical protein AB7N76_01720 [Planctomycetota bacterium]
MRRDPDLLLALALAALLCGGCASTPEPEPEPPPPTSSAARQTAELAEALRRHVEERRAELGQAFPALDPTGPERAFVTLETRGVVLRAADPSRVSPEQLAAWADAVERRARELALAVEGIHVAHDPRPLDAWDWQGTCGPGYFHQERFATGARDPLGSPLLRVRCGVLTRHLPPFRAEDRELHLGVCVTAVAARADDAQAARLQGAVLERALGALEGLGREEAARLGVTLAAR